MRTPLLLAALVLAAACGSSDRRSAADPAAPSLVSRGPDAVVLRVPRAGGRVTAALYPNVDSIVWRSSGPAAAPGRVLGFDEEAGVLALVDARGTPVRVDLRLGTVRGAGKDPLQLPVAGNAGDVFGVAGDGAVVRLTPSGDAWRLRLPIAVQQLLPQRDGSVLVVAARGGTGYVWELRPPTARPTDSATIAGAGRAIATGAGDRAYFIAGTELVGVRARGLEALRPVPLDAPVRAIAATPSGDRFYVVTDRPGELLVVDRYSDRVAGRITLPGEARALRMDPLGRFLLVQSARGDSAWVVAVGTDRLIASMGGTWREDLPTVLPDGAIANVEGDDVVFRDGQTLDPERRVPGGAADLWHLVLWNGFRPRAAGLDQPVTFGGGTGGTDSGAADSAAVDSLAAPVDSATVPADSTHVPTPPESTATPAALVAGARPTVPGPDIASLPPGRGYMVQFAAAGSENEARRVAGRLHADAPARVVPTARAGQTLWRVVMGPFATRAEADRIGRGAGASYWVYEGVP